LRVSLNDVELYRGEVAQGCGNQIFEYCHKIRLIEQQIADNRQPTHAGEMSHGQPQSTSASPLSAHHCE